MSQGVLVLANDYPHQFSFVNQTLGQQYYSRLQDQVKWKVLRKLVRVKNFSLREELDDLYSPGKNLMTSLNNSIRKSQNMCGVILNLSPEIDPFLLNKAFSAIKAGKLVIGPLRNGQLYFLGSLKELNIKGLNEIDWKSNAVFGMVVSILKRENIDFEILPRLDTFSNEDDLNQYPDLLPSIHTH